MFARNRVPPVDLAEWNQYGAAEKFALRQRLVEAEAKRSQVIAWGVTIAVDTAVITGLVALVGTLLTKQLEVNATLELEREKFRNEIVQKGIDPENLEKSQQYWDLLIKNGIVERRP